MHCVGMCGPIALAAGGQGRFANALLYNFGRTVTYGLLGGLIGLVGKGIYLSGIQKHIAIGIGVGLLSVAVFSINVEAKLLKISAFDQFVFRLKSGIGRWLKSRGGAGAFTVGLLNGLLPCGLVYMAVVGALSTGHWFSGMMYMALFGLGTFPLMLLANLFGGLLSWKARTLISKLYPAFLVVFALAFIVRGLNFHVPGDFFFFEKMQDMPMCH